MPRLTQKQRKISSSAIKISSNYVLKSTHTNLTEREREIQGFTSTLDLTKPRILLIKKKLNHVTSNTNNFPHKYAMNSHITI